MVILHGRTVRDTQKSTLRFQRRKLGRIISEDLIREQGLQELVEPHLAKT